MNDSAKLIQEVYYLEEKINKLYARIPYDLESEFFLYEEKEQLEKEDSELTFKNIVSYLYKLYFERNGVNIKVIVGLAHLAGIEKNDILYIKNLIHDFRTKSEHYLDLKEKNNGQIKRKCLLWFISVLSKDTPETNDDWYKCVVEILQKAIKSLESIFIILSEIIKRDEQLIYEQWRIKQQRNIPKHKKIEVLENIKRRYGYCYDTNILYQKKQMQFDSVLEFLDFNDVIMIEQFLQRQYESIVLTMDIFPCPLSGKEVQEKYKINNEEVLKEVMKKVNEYYRTNNTTDKLGLLKYIETLNLISKQVPLK